MHQIIFNHLSSNPTKWSNTLKQFVGKLVTNRLSVFDHFLILALKVLIIMIKQNQKLGSPLTTVSNVQNPKFRVQYSIVASRVQEFWYVSYYGVIYFINSFLKNLFFYQFPECLEQYYKTVLWKYLPMMKVITSEHQRLLSAPYQIGKP